MNTQIKLRSALATVAIAVVSTTAITGSVTAATTSDETNAAAQIDPAALARAQQKFAHAQQVAEQFTDRAKAEGLLESWRVQMINTLMKSPESSFAQVQSAANARAAMQAAFDLSVAQTRAANASSAEPKLLGDSGDDLTFIPLTTPCRIVDTRASGAGGALAAGATRVFNFAGSQTQQGGSTSCTPFAGYLDQGLPGAAAINITVDARGSTAVQGSFLAAFPDGGSAGSSWLNFAGGEVVANEGILGISSLDKFDITVNGVTNVIVDVYGSFIAPQATALDCQDTAKVTATLPVSAGGVLGWVGITSATCPVGYTITSGSCFGGTRGDEYQLQEHTITATGAWFCSWNNYSGTATESMAASSHCCRVPGR